MLSKKLLHFAVAMLLLPVLTFAQNTTGSISGSVKADNGEVLVGATITVLHVPTGTVYNAQTRKSGLFDVSNVQPGGPYAVTVSYVNYQSEKKEDIYVALGDVVRVDVILSSKIDKLKDVTVTTTRRGSDLSVRGGTQTIIGRDKLDNLPTVGRNVQDFLRFSPTAKFVGGNGDLAGVSIAGQNNRFNSLYIDGAVNNDQFGLSASGTNGGQTGVGPISIDAVDQFQVMVSPFDASIGNFTGGGINATTKGGTNKVTGTVYSFMQNQNLSGKTPTGAKEKAVKLNPFKAQTIGGSVGGAIVKNKLFYFVNFESIENERPQPFDISGYKGTSGKADIDKLVDFVQTKYGYNTGGYQDNAASTSAKRLATKIDWNVNKMNKFSLSYRYNETNSYATSASSSSRVNFYNNGVLYPNKTNSLSAELKSAFKNGSSNKFLFTYTDVMDDRNPIGAQFPRVTINDGAGQMIFGSEEFSTSNLLKQRNVNFLDYFKFNVNKHAFTVGVDYELSKSYNVFIRQNYGSYQFSSLSDFLAEKAPTRYDRSFSLLDQTTGDNTRAAAKFYTGRGSAFINDEFRYSDNLTFNYGVRADYTKFLSTPLADNYFNFNMPKNWDLQGARSGSMPDPKISISPRVGFTYKMPAENITIRGGFGMFTGRVPLVWPGGVYNNNGQSVGGISITNATDIAKYGIKFRPNPNGQYTAADLGLSTAAAKGQLDLIANDFKLPKLFRASLAIDKKLKDNWSVTVEGSVSKNINEIYYTRVDIKQPVGQLAGPDNRYIYDLKRVTFPAYQGLAAGINPYTGIFVIHNQPYYGRSGFAYNFTASIDKSWTDGFSFNAFYTYGSSFVTNEPTSSQNNSQWRYMETVNGRNNVQRSRSDFDLGHRVSAFVAKKFTYAKGALASTFSLVYNGQSGNPFSYVYATGPVRDQGTGETNDLIFIPTADQIKAMTFVTNSSYPLSADAQKAALESYIAQDNYLSKNRGKYAERNGGRLPFTNIIDVKFVQDFNVKLNNKKYQFQLTYDIFNFTNMLNRNWGRTYFMSNDQFAIIKYQGATGSTTPSYSFSPISNNTPWGISSSTSPSYSARWVSQLGLRFKF
ncbi:MAG: TonB-dependent receptor [Sediminibacterium sp.]|nr:TonB-dependent receptor [Sediminibacterium sp.]MBP6144861.1 TonB-dependent receptor [Sediminibacterium sp.]